MANFVDTSYRALGPSDQLDKLYEAMLALSEDGDPEAEISMDSLVESLDGTSEVGEENMNTYSRGCWSFLSRERDEADEKTVAVCFDTETAWAELASWRCFVESRFPGVRLWFHAMGQDQYYNYYKTNDRNGKVFKDQYILHHEGDYQYFPSLESLATGVAEILKVDSIKVDDFKKLQKIAKLNAQLCEEIGNDDKWFSVNKFKWTR